MSEKEPDNTKLDSAMGDTSPDSESDRSSLNRETGVLAWSELLRFFARGVVIKVGADLDLVEVGHCMATDDTATMQTWLDASLIARASDDDARDWAGRTPEPEFWCLVAAPWVLVQERDKVVERHNVTDTVH